MIRRTYRIITSRINRCICHRFSLTKQKSGRYYNIITCEFEDSWRLYWNTIYLSEVNIIGSLSFVTLKFGRKMSEIRRKDDRNQNVSGPVGHSKTSWGGPNSNWAAANFAHCSYEVCLKVGGVDSAMAFIMWPKPFNTFMKHFRSYKVGFRIFLTVSSLPFRNPFLMRR